MNRPTFLTLVLAVFSVLACATPMAAPGDCAAIKLDNETIETEALIHEVGVAEVEAKNLRDGVPFGDRHAEWEKLKGELQPGDELWLYRDNRAMAGAEGYLLVRDCEVIAFVMTTKY